MSQTPPSFYDPNAVAHDFDEFGDREWNRLVETPMSEVSLHIHTHYLRQYIPKDSRVLEIGAGAGRFTQILGQISAHILVADISPVQLELNQHYAQLYGFATFVEGWQLVDMCKMDPFQDGSFDCVVAYGGPFSYVLDQREDALHECLRILKPGGLLLLSVMSLWGTAHSALEGVMNMPPSANQQIISSGDLTPATYPGRRSKFMHLFRSSELRQWLIRSGLSILAVSASSCLSTGWNEYLKGIIADQILWQELLRMEVEASAEPGCWDMGTHIICVAKK